jgi:hypothetical protein
VSRRQLSEPLETLEKQVIETLLAGYPYCEYPESHSDLQGCVRNLLRMFEVKRRPLAIELEYRPEASAGPQGEA